MKLTSLLQFVYKLESASKIDNFNESVAFLDV